MIIQCPNCSTGFNLPDKHITSKGAKLRCSRCSFVFRVRRDDPDQEIEFFYKPEDEAANAERVQEEPVLDEAPPAGLGADDSVAIELGADFEALLNSAPTPKERAVEVAATDEPSEAEADEAQSNQTQIGLPGVTENKASLPSSPGLSGYGFGSSSSSSSDVDPFPLAGGSLKGFKDKIKVPNPTSGLSGSSVTSEPEAPVEPEVSSEAPAEPEAPGIDLFDGEPEASISSGQDPFAGAFEDGLDPQSLGIPVNPAPAPAEEDPILQPGQPTGPAAFESSPLQTAAVQPEVSVPEASSSPPVLQGSGGGAFVDAGDFVDPSFGSQGPSFDSQQGVVQASAPQPKPVAAAPAPAPQRAPAPRPVAAPVAAALDPGDAWPTKADAIAAHKIGGGGAQKFANVILIIALVMVGFLGLVATLNDGFLDFKQFGSMIEVAFSNGEYKPRAEWLPKEKQEPKAAMESPLRTESVWAEVISYGKRKKEKALVVRGMLRNFDQQDYLDVSLRGIVLNGKEKIIAEKVVPLGVLVSNVELSATSALDDMDAFIPKSAPPLKVASSEPFTIIFDEIPDDVKEGEPVFFRVDVAKSTGRDGIKAP